MSNARVIVASHRVERRLMEESVRVEAPVLVSDSPQVSYIRTVDHPLRFIKLA